MTQLREYRKARQLTLGDVSELTGIALNMVSRHERGIYMPKPIQIEKYRKLTGGEVTSADWARLQKERKRAKEATSD